MHLVFENSMPVSEQLLRASTRKKVGRKHCKKKGPGKAKSAAMKNVANHAKLMSAKARKHKAAVAAFWRGEIDIHPKGM